jgi:hypothetical protein
VRNKGTSGRGREKYGATQKRRVAKDTIFTPLISFPHIFGPAARAPRGEKREKKLVLFLLQPSWSVVCYRSPVDHKSEQGRSNEDEVIAVETLLQKKILRARKMFVRFVLPFVLSVTCCFGGLLGPVSTGTQTISTTVGNITPGGMEGLGIEWAVPYNIGDMVVGFKFALTSLSKTLMPDSLFAKRTIATPFPLDGSATIDTDFNLIGKVFSADASWAAKNTDLVLSASANSVDQLTNIGYATKATVGATKTALSGSYNFLKKKLAASLKVDYKKSSAQVSYDTIAQDPILKLTQKLDSANSVSPTLHLKSLKQMYSWTHTLPPGGSVETTFVPYDKVGIVWKDKGAGGVWVTKLDIPVEDTSKAKISLGHEWTY